MRSAWVLLLVGCSFHNINYASDLDYVHMYGDRIDATPGRRILAWPADHEGAKIRWVYDEIPHQIAEAPIRTWPGGTSARSDIAGVIVILPPGRSDAMRGRVRSFIEESTRNSENAGRHVVVGTAPWYDVDDGNTLHARLMELHRLAARHRVTSADDGVFVPGTTLRNIGPDYHIMPIRESTVHFAVYSVDDGMDSDLGFVSPKEMTTEEILGLTTTREGPEGVRIWFDIEAPKNAPWVTQLVGRLLQSRDQVHIRLFRVARLKSRKDEWAMEMQLLYPFVFIEHEDE